MKNLNEVNGVNIIWEQNLSDEVKAAVLESQKFNDWFVKANSEFILTSINIQSVDMFGSNRVGFIKLKAEITDKEGHRLPGIVFIRGNSVSVLFVINNTDTGEEYCALVTQGRVPIAKAECFESPAGMMDEEKNVSGVAIKEVEEELHMNIDSDGLEFLCDAYTSPGGQDEKIDLYFYKHYMTAAEIAELNGRITGEEGSNEKIKVKVVPLNEFLNYNRSAAGQLAYRTYVMEHVN